MLKFFLPIANTLTKKKLQYEFPCCPHFSGTGLQSENFRENVSFFLATVNFVTIYLRFCSYFTQDIYTHSKGFLVSFPMMYMTILSLLQFLSQRKKFRKICEKIPEWTRSHHNQPYPRRYYDYGEPQRSPFPTKKDLRTSEYYCSRYSILSSGCQLKFSNYLYGKSYKKRIFT